MKAQNVFLRIAYRGTNYRGWQVQPNLPTVQGEIEKAYFSISGEKITLHGSGRTDAGVHATAQTATFLTQASIPVHKIAVALNSVLPKDIVIRGAYPVKSDFHARFSALGKTYEYKIYYGQKRDPFLESLYWHYPFAFDVNAISSGLILLKGKHDFKAFQSTGSFVEHTERTIHDIKLEIEENKKILSIEVTGDGFLYNMVRILVGTLMDIGGNKREPSCILAAYDLKERALLGQTAPSEGLYLKRVYYSSR